MARAQGKKRDVFDVHDKRQIEDWLTRQGVKPCTCAKPGKREIFGPVTLSGNTAAFAGVVARPFAAVICTACGETRLFTLLPGGLP